MAQACEGLHCLEAQLAWLRAALDVDPKDADINKACALALGEAGALRSGDCVLGARGKG